MSPQALEANKFAVIPHTIITLSTIYHQRFCSYSD